MSYYTTPESINLANALPWLSLQPFRRTTVMTRIRDEPRMTRMDADKGEQTEK